MMSSLDRVQAVLDHVEAHLHEPVTLDALARAAGVSRYHLHRLFQAGYGESLKAYIRKRRLTWAARQLRQSRTRIIELALECGFESQAAFTRAFKALYGVAPGRYRDDPRQRYQSGLRPPDAGTLLQRRSIRAREPAITQLDRTLSLSGTGIGVEFEDDARVAHLWRDILARQAPDMAADTTLYGVTMSDHPDVPDTPDRCLVYFAAAEVGAMPAAGTTDLVIPCGTYAVFQHAGPADRILDTVNYAWASWLPRSGFSKSARPDFECMTASSLGQAPGGIALWMSVERADGAEYHGEARREDSRQDQAGPRQGRE